MRDVDLAWLAGIVDGEGTMGVYAMRQKPKREGLKATHTHVVNFSVANTDARIIVRMRALCDELLGHEPMTSVQKPKISRGNTPKYQVMITNSRDVLIILRAIEPYLVGKSDQARVLRVLLERRRLGSRWTAEDQAVIPLLKQLKRPWTGTRSQAEQECSEGSETRAVTQIG